MTEFSVFHFPILIFFSPFLFFLTPIPALLPTFTFLCSNTSHSPALPPSLYIQRAPFRPIFLFLYSNPSHFFPFFLSLHSNSPHFSSFFTSLFSNLSYFPTPSPFLYSNTPHSTPLFSPPLFTFFSFNILYSIPFLPSFSFSSKPNHAPKLRKYISPQNPKPENPFILSKSSHTSSP